MSTNVSPNRRMPALAAATVAIAGFLLSFAAPGLASAAVTEAHYERSFQLTCGGAFCAMELPKLTPGNRIKVTRISCLMVAKADAILGTVNYEYDGGAPLHQYIPPTQASATYSVFNQKVEILVLPGKLFQIALSAKGTVSEGLCALTGIKQKLT